MPHSVDLSPTTIHDLGIIPRGNGGASARDLRTAVRRAQLTRLAREGLNATQAAEVVGVSKDTARRDYRDPAFQRRVLNHVDAAYAAADQTFIDRRASLHDLLIEQAYDSFEDLVGMLAQEDLPKALRVKINQDFLNRTPETAQHTNSHLRIDPTHLATAAAAAREMDNKVIVMKSVVPGGLDTGDGG